MKTLAVIILALIAILALVAMIGNSASSAQQAQAAIEAARAAQVSAAGQSIATLAVSALAILLTILILAAIAAGVYLWLRLRRPARPGGRGQGNGNWISGPMAYWGKKTLPAIDFESLPPDVQEQLLLAAQQRILLQMRLGQTYQLQGPSNPRLYRNQWPPIE